MDCPSPAFAFKKCYFKYHMKGGEDTFVCGALKMCIPIYNCIYFRGLRVKAAKDNGIAEESCGSFLLKMWCCGACMVCQTGNEVGAWNMAEEMEKQTQKSRFSTGRTAAENEKEERQARNNSNKNNKKTKKTKKT